MILLYEQAGNDVFGKLKQRLNGKASAVSLESYTHLEDLFHRLRKPRVNLKIGVLAITDVAELDRLLAIRELLADMRLVLDLADDDPTTLAKAHALAPRFITFIDNGIEPLVSVVERMMECRANPTAPTTAAREAVLT